MSRLLPSPLPLFDRSLLRAVERVVPAAERADWSRTWQAELWHMRHRSRTRTHNGNRRSGTLGITTELSIGLMRDALWLRSDSWRRAFQGTGTLCLASLAGCCLVSTLIALAFSGSWHALGLSLRGQLERSLVAASLVVFVTFATASRRHIEQSSTGKTIYRIKRRLFFAAKSLLVLLLSFLLSVDICEPIHPAFPNIAFLLQLFFVVLFGLAGLRWAFRDRGHSAASSVSTRWARRHA